MTKALFLSLLCLSCLTLKSAENPSPYAVAAHVTYGVEHGIFDKEFPLMRQIGITSVRSDFSWSHVNPAPGVWKFDHLDKVVESAQKNNIELLAILCYDVPWATPSYQHLDKWCEYVEKVVARYKGKVKYFEVYNEPNVSAFWRTTPSGKNYGKLLKASAAAIRRANPEAVVLFGGIVLFPFDYLQEAFDEAGTDSFDILSIHPYSFPAEPESRRLHIKYAELKRFMKKNNAAAKPIWITELGWSTILQYDFPESIIRSGLKALALDRRPLKVAVIADPDFGQEMKELDLSATFPAGSEIARLTIAKVVRDLKYGKYDVFMMPPVEDFPVAIYATVKGFVKDGGTLISWCGLPFHYALETRADGNGMNRKTAGESFRRDLRIGWDSWWKTPGTPKKSRHLTVAPPFQDTITLPAPDSRSHEVQRYPDASLLKGNDKLIPLIQCREVDFNGVGAAVYRFDSDYKGSIILSTFWHSMGITEELQSKLVGRSYLLSLMSGIERMYWFEFHSLDDKKLGDANSFFGLTRFDLTPKPAFHAYRTLTEQCPPGSKFKTGTWYRQNLFYPGWITPEGKHVYALWCTGSDTVVKLAADGAVTAATDHLGRPASLPSNGELKLTGAPLYLIGPATLQITPR